MHGRLKVRTTEAQKLLKQQEQQKKLGVYKQCMKEILGSRKPDSYEPEAVSKCAYILTINPDIYTLWNFRKEVVLMKMKESKQDDENGETNLIDYLESEKKLTQESLRVNPKSYGAWHHRYWVMLKHPKPDWQKEFDLINQYLSMDDRNFHSWDYRRLIINQIGITLPSELAFSTERLNQNFSNYSSWHYRSTLLRNLDESSTNSELQLVQNAVFTDPEDSSAWIYLRWILSNPSIMTTRRQELLASLEELEAMEPHCKWLCMAKCWLAGSLCLSDPQFAGKLVEFYKKLLELDPMRKGQYNEYLRVAQQQE